MSHASAAPEVPLPAAAAPPRRKVGLLGLVGVTFFIVSGGPYGLEDLLSSAGYQQTVLILIVMPFLWSLPTALLVGELAAALPESGGFYAWVRRALGRFWGFQEAWLSFAASIFDMALYPTMFVAYLSHLFPVLQKDSQTQLLLALGLVIVCAAWNAWGAKAVGGASVALGAILIGPFFFLGIFAFLQPAHPIHASASGASRDLLGGIVIAMFNYAGWDNASTIANEVDRPQRNYPWAMFITNGLVMLVYLVPVLALMRTGMDTSNWTAGAWADAGTTVAGPWLASAIVVGGCCYAVGTYNALTMSSAHLVSALAEDRLLPRILAKRTAKGDAPVYAVILCSVAYASCLGLGFKKLILIDYMLYGLSIVVEFIALLVLRIREPSLPRPFRIPGGIGGIIFLALGPTALTVIAIIRTAQEGSGSALLVCVGLILFGPVLYGLSKLLVRVAEPGEVS